MVGARIRRRWDGPIAERALLNLSHGRSGRKAFTVSARLFVRSRSRSVATVVVRVGGRESCVLRSVEQSRSALVGLTGHGASQSCFAAPGVYGWHFEVAPFAELAAEKLLYVGIAPRQMTARISSQNLRKRVRYHFQGNAAGSTLRLTLGCLLGLEL